MIVILQAGISVEQRRVLEEFFENRQLQVHEIVGTGQSAIGAIGKPGVRLEELTALPGVQEVIPISKPYKRASREFQTADSVYRMGRLHLGGQRVVLALELPLSQAEKIPKDLQERQITAYTEALRVLRQAGLSILSYSPKSLGGDIYDPEGLHRLNQKQLRQFEELKHRSGLALLCHVPGLGMLEELAACADILQVPGQQMRNMELLAALAASSRPLILERAADASLEEFLLAAEFLLSNGQQDLILSESFMPNPARLQSPMLDFANIQALQELSHLPVFVSLRASSPYNVGRSAQLASLAAAALAAGAQGLEFSLSPSSVLKSFAAELQPETVRAFLQGNLGGGGGASWFLGS